MSVNVREIDPEALYSFREAAKLIPSSRGKKTLHVHTLHRWRAENKIAAVRVHSGWFIYGGELLRLLSADQAPVFVGRTPSQRERDIQAAFADAKRLGV